MNKRTLSWLIVIVICIAAPIFIFQGASAEYDQIHGVGVAQLNPQAAQTLIPTPPPVYQAGYPTPEPRVLPSVGSNAGLVIGASVLVLIIIGGVLSGRLRQKH